MHHRSRHTRWLHRAEIVTLLSTWVALTLTIITVGIGLAEEANPLAARFFADHNYIGVAAVGFVGVVVVFRLLESATRVAARSDHERLEVVPLAGASVVALTSVADAVRNLILVVQFEGSFDYSLTGSAGEGMATYPMFPYGGEVAVVAFAIAVCLWPFRQQLLEILRLRVKRRDRA